ncbi:protein-L-isoaspartate(D-aspartate) O-methyltransferase [Robiginitalea sp. IMCC43444]|uniref:protein-L-isoaspartate(D-aspartate) O-methyltransferase n=1 Tax=Robiginitalea sp. IMCC43444 TaxID=3459121 RepID=UPI0040434720
MKQDWIKGIIKHIFLFLGFTCLKAQEPDFTALRAQMVREQLKARDIRQEAVLNAMESIPRHLFVPENKQPFAYEDGPLSIGEGQTISQPYIVAFMTQALKLKGDEKVLEIGTGSGYQAAVLAAIAHDVYTIEIVPSLGKAARERLVKMGYNNIELRIGDGYAGWPEQAPFDAIMVTAGAEEIPEPLLQQLAEGGRMLIPLGPHRGVRDLVLIEKKKGKFRQKNLMKVRFVPFTRKKS